MNASSAFERISSPPFQPAPTVAVSVLPSPERLRLPPLAADAQVLVAAGADAALEPARLALADAHVEDDRGRGRVGAQRLDLDRGEQAAAREPLGALDQAIAAVQVAGREQDLAHDRGGVDLATTPVTSRRPTRYGAALPDRRSGCRPGRPSRGAVVSITGKWPRSA